MAALTIAPQTPEHIFQVINSYQQSAALKAAIELDLFTKIDEGATDPAAIAAAIGASARGVRILCDALTVMGFLAKADRRYALTAESALFLTRKSPAYLGSVTGFLLNDGLVSNYWRLDEAVRRGGTASGQGDNQQPHEDLWVRFAKAMPPFTRPLARAMTEAVGMAQAGSCRILDIAAGHGMYGITMAQANPKAEVVAVDWPAVLEVAQENAEAAGVSDRFSTRPGSAFTADLGEGYDFALLTNIFHHFDQPTCERLMQRVCAALKPGGKAIAVEFVPNEDRISPPIPAMFSLTMLAMTDRGEAYTASEYQRMFQNCGFHNMTVHALAGMPQTILIAEKTAAA